MEPLLTVLAEPARRRAVELLRGRALSAGEIERALGLSQPSTSKHLKALREAGLVTVQVDAQRRIYSLNPAPLEALDAWLQPFRPFWEARLDALERHLDQEC
jgi:DNA-binding transcriptional ArsR family regulator